MAEKSSGRRYSGMGVALCVSLAVGLGGFFAFHVSNHPESNSPTAVKTLGPTERIDLGEFFVSLDLPLNSPLSTLSEIIPKIQPLSNVNEHSPLDVPVNGIVNFTENPLDTTLTLLTTTRETFALHDKIKP